jgi:hypothetical protein
VRALADVADALLLLAPSVTPPPGFTDRVLDAMASAPTAATAAPARQRRWRTRHLVAAAAVALALGVGATATVVATRPEAPSRQVSLSGRFRAVPMMGPTDHAVGSAYVSTGDDPWMLVDVSYGLDSEAYRLVGVTTEGSVVDIGGMRAGSNNGAQWTWAGRLPHNHTLAEVRIVDGAGDVACRAALV